MGLDQTRSIHIRLWVSRLLISSYIFDTKKNHLSGTSMGRQVRLSFQQIFENLGSMNSDQSQQHLHHLQLKSRYVQELWD
jgi:hypothetical protein